MTPVDQLMHRAHVRGSVDAWNQLEKARLILLTTGRNAYIDYDVVLSLVEDLQKEQDRLIALRPREGA